VYDLRQKKLHMIDEKSMKNIRNKQVGFKVYDENNSINCFTDSQKICYGDLSKNPYGGDLYLGVNSEKYQLIANPNAYMQ